MKTAFVHDWIVSIGGAEEVLKKLIDKENFQEGMIFTLFSTHQYLETEKHNIPIKPVISSNFIIKKIGYRNLMPLFPLLTFLMSRKIKKYSPEKTVISSFAVSKNIKTPGYKKLYLHSPMQYIRGSYSEYLEKFSTIKKAIFKLTSSYLRKRDKKRTDFDEIYFNSQHTRETAKEIYGISGEIAYPPIDKTFLNTSPSKEIRDYFVYIGRLVKFSKEVDKVIKLFNETGEKLLIVGEGPDEEELKRMADENILFTGHISDTQEKINILKKARGFINLTKESFGMATAEALMCGVPVFGYIKGGSGELIDSKSGILVPSKDMKTLHTKFAEFRKKSFNREEIKENFLTKYKKRSIETNSS